MKLDVLEILSLTEAAKLIIDNDLGSTSLLCRKMAINFNQASEIMDKLEKLGIVSPFNDGTKPRKVLVTKAEASKLIK